MGSESASTRGRLGSESAYPAMCGRPAKSVLTALPLPTIFLMAATRRTTSFSCCRTGSLGLGSTQRASLPSGHALKPDGLGVFRLPSILAATGGILFRPARSIMLRRAACPFLGFEDPFFPPSLYFWLFLPAAAALVVLVWWFLFLASGFLFFVSCFLLSASCSLCLVSCLVFLV